MILQQTLAFVDIETTGLDSDIHEIIELGVVFARIKDGELVVVDTLDIKIIPKNIEKADPIALRVNGYDEADWLFALDIKDAIKIFSEKSEGTVFLAHNLLFDYSFIQKAFKNNNIENKLHFQKIDTLSMAFGILQNQNDLGKLSLRYLCEKFEIENKKAHSAFADAYALYGVFKKLLNLK